MGNCAKFKVKFEILGKGNTLVELTSLEGWKAYLADCLSE
jgi:hypothetical protein